MLTQAEFAAHVARGFKGAKTAAELAADAQTLFDRYNRSSLEYDGEQVVTKDEAWRIVSEGDYKNEVYKREIARLPYSSHEGFASMDDDHDDILLVTDLIGKVHDATIV